jgi:hypothetical protein
VRGRRPGQRRRPHRLLTGRPRDHVLAVRP